jgi:hypothetical protein
MLKAVYLLNLSRIRIDPVHLLIAAHVGKSLLVFRAKEAAHVDPPILIVLTPPIEVDVEMGL